MPSSTVKLLKSPDRQCHDVRASYVVLGALGVLLGATIGYWASSGSQRLLALLVGLTFPVLVAILGEKWAALCLLALAPYPLLILYAASTPPLTWIAVAVLAVLLLADARTWNQARSCSAPRLSRWDIVLPTAFAVSAGVSALAAGQYQGLTTTMGPPVVIAVSVMGGCLVGAAIARNWAASLGLRVGVVGAGFVLALLALQAAFPSLSIPGIAGTSHVRYAGLVRVGGVIGDYELLAEYLALWGVAALWLAVAPHQRKRPLWMAASLGCVLGLLATGTRGGAGLYLVGAVVVCFAQRRSRQRLRLVAIVGSTVVLGIVISGYFSGTGGLVGRISATPLSGGFTEAINRKGLWGPYLVFDGPATYIVLGHGPGVNLSQLPAYPHSLYVYLYYTQGLVGVGLMALVLGVAIRPTVAALMKRSEWGVDAVLGLLVFLFAIDQIKVEFIRIHNYQLEVWCLLGLAAAARAITRRESSSVVSTKRDLTDHLLRTRNRP